MAYGTRRFNTAFTRVLSLSWAESTQLPALIPISSRSILILSSHLKLGLPKGLFPVGLPVHNELTTWSLQRDFRFNYRLRKNYRLRFWPTIPLTLSRRGKFRTPTLLGINSGTAECSLSLSLSLSFSLCHSSGMVIFHAYTKININLLIEIFDEILANYYASIYILHLYFKA